MCYGKCSAACFWLERLTDLCQSQGMSTKVLLLTSMCLNIGLGFAYWWMTRPVELPAIEPSRPLVVSTAGAKASVVSAIFTNVIPQEFQWSQLETTDYKEYIKRLRALNCPESTIQDIILADLDNLYEPKLNALRGHVPVAEPDRYWVHVKPPPAKLSPEADWAVREVQAERASLVRELLGVTERSLRVKHDRHDDAVQSRYAFLAAEQRERLIELEKQYGVFPEENNNSGRIIFWHLELSAEQLTQMRIELAEFMSAEQIREYDLRTAKHARHMKNDFETIGVNEAEFRAAYDAYDSWSLARHERYDFQNPPTPERLEAVKQQENRAIEDMKRVLGAERYAEFRLYRDMAYTELIKAAPYLGFDAAAAKKVVEMRVEVNKAVDVLRRNEALSEEARQQALLEIRLATEKAVTGVIGQRGYEYYQRQGGRWMNAISPRKQPATQP